MLDANISGANLNVARSAFKRVFVKHIRVIHFISKRYD